MILVLTPNLRQNKNQNQKLLKSIYFNLLLKANIDGAHITPSLQLFHARIQRLAKL